MTQYALTAFQSALSKPAAGAASAWYLYCASVHPVSPVNFCVVDPETHEKRWLHSR